MATNFPSMTALLALLAVAGYQNRDKIAEMIGKLKANNPQVLGQDNQVGLDGVLGSVRNALGSTGIGGLLSNGLGELAERFKQNGLGETADSWVKHGPNKEVSPQQLKEAIGPDVLATLSQQTGLPSEELLARLSRELPNAVDRYTPDGRLPS